MKLSGATEATARRLRYEVAAVIESYGMAMEEGASAGVTLAAGKVVAEGEPLDAGDLEAQESWLGLVNSARNLRNAAMNRKRQLEGAPRQIGRGNHTVRKFGDAKFDKLREQLIERTAENQALDLLDAAIMAVAKAYSAIASDDIERLREAEKRIHDKVNLRPRARSEVLSIAKGPILLRA